MKIKICGITNLEDARAAIAAGADMLGVNFYRPSPRCITPDAARELVNDLNSYDRPVEVVGVFVNETVDAIIDIAVLTGIDLVQLHGDESPSICEEINTRNGFSVIKALRVGERFSPQDATQYPVDAIMLDAFHQTLRGGTGQTIDLDVARATHELVPRLFLSGGLSPENVAAAIAAVNPYGIDACSSLESSPGKKDAERMRAFVQAARNR
ncbi:MAG TPA: phosphoribosylanthranilate isomerase [Pyrinomonadaceae bacterium]|nr:phosphoribosylanthranilate isomerase [Pyrinomonadaceae bacterium]